MTKEIQLTKGQIALVDDEDYEYLSRFIWKTMKVPRIFYAYSGHILLHRLNMGNPKTLIVDHIDHNGLNNKKDNLRLCTRQENIMGKRKSEKSFSKYKGVTFNSGSWRARITINRKGIHLIKYQTTQVKP